MLAALASEAVTHGAASIDPITYTHVLGAHDPAPDLVLLDWINLGLAIGGVLFAVLGLAYAFLAAKRADQAVTNTESLIRRLIVEPLRDLDGKYGALDANEQAMLRLIYDVGRKGKDSVGTSKLKRSQLQPNLTSNDRLEYLLEEGWLTLTGNQWNIAPERVQYLTITFDSMERE